MKGGCVSIEITNEGNGWHLHAHWLVDSVWTDASTLAITWGHLVGQSFAIVKVIPVKEKAYVHEVCKYLAKGSELAGWTPEQLLEFTLAIHSNSETSNQTRSTATAARPILPLRRTRNRFYGKNETTGKERNADEPAR